MKKNLLIILSILLILSFLAGCGAGGRAPSIGSGASYPSSAPAAPPELGIIGDSSNSYDKEMPAPSPSQQMNSGNSVLNPGDLTTDGTDTTSDLSQKIIYSAYADIETTSFDDSVNGVYAMLGAFKAFIENSNISGSSYSDSYYGRPSYRAAQFTLRVPSASFTSMTNALSGLGNVVSFSTNADNITANYIDTQSRLDAYRTEESRLLAMLDKADKVEDMITIESRLSDVRYNIESLTSTLRNMQNQVDYSTVSVTIREVAKLTDQVPVTQTYWEKIGSGLYATLRGVANFFKWLFRAIIVALPVIVILAVIAVVVILIVRRRRKKANAPPANNNKKDE